MLSLSPHQNVLGDFLKFHVLIGNKKGTNAPLFLTQYWSNFELTENIHSAYIDLAVISYYDNTMKEKASEQTLRLPHIVCARAELRVVFRKIL